MNSQENAHFIRRGTFHPRWFSLNISLIPGCRTSELEAAVHELNKVKAQLGENTEQLQSLFDKQQDMERLLSESQRTVSTLARQRDELAAEIAELSDEKKGKRKAILNPLRLYPD